MAGIDTGDSHGGRKSINQEIPLVPFIDFLLCCVMFLLVTAVWNQLAKVDANHAAFTLDPSTETDPPVLRRLRIAADGYSLIVGQEPAETIARVGERYDVGRLANRLAVLQQQDPERHDLVLEAADGVRYADVVDAMDVTAGAGLTEFSVSPVSIGAP